MTTSRYHTIMRTEVKVDVYAGEEHNNRRPFFNTQCDGDMGDNDNHTNDIVLNCNELPPGTKIFVEVPCCPSCWHPREEIFKRTSTGSMKIVGFKNNCHCGFDWDEWEEEQYS